MQRPHKFWAGSQPPNPVKNLNKKRLRHRATYKMPDQPNRPTAAMRQHPTESDKRSRRGHAAPDRPRAYSQNSPPLSIAEPVENPIESPIAARYVKDCRLRTHQFKRQSSKPYLMRIQRSHPRQTKSRLVILLNAFVVTAVVQTQRTGLAFFGS